MRKINIFKRGLQTSSTGFEKEFTDSDLMGMVSSFDSSVHEPPVRIGHEDNDKVPAFGWVKKVSGSDGKLYADIEFTPETEDLIKKGHYKKVSASFYSPDSPVNPKKGFYTLKHVALLGGVAPAVKGLEPFGFSENKEVINTMTVDLELDFKEDADKAQEKAKPEVPKEVTPKEEETEEVEEKEEEPEEEDFSEKEKEALEAKITELESRFSELSSTAEEAKALNERLQEMETKFKEMEEAKLAAEEVLLKERKERRREEIQEGVDYLYSEGQMTEGIYSKEKLFEFAVGLEEGTLEFAEGESAVDSLFKILSSIPAPVSFKEVAPDSQTVVEESKEKETLDWAEVVDKHAKEKGITFEQALKELS